MVTASLASIQLFYHRHYLHEPPPPPVHHHHHHPYPHHLKDGDCIGKDSIDPTELLEKLGNLDGLDIAYLSMDL